jgi:hypothetical protein
VDFVVAYFQFKSMLVIRALERIVCVNDDKFSLTNAIHRHPEIYHKIIPFH